MSSATQPSESRPILYDDERSPDCRRVRLAIMSLDLDVEVRPCPPGGARFVPELKRIGGRDAPPVLVDAAFELTLTDPEEIITHLRAARGTNPAATFGPASSALELYSYETCPFCAYVREALCQLELPYTLRSMGPGSEKRGAFRARYGKTQFPFLRDSEAGVELFESAAIVRHLRKRRR